MTKRAKGDAVGTPIADDPLPPHGYPPMPTKHRVWPWVVGGVLLVVFNLAGGCAIFVGTLYITLDRETKREVGVTYDVTGAGTAVDVTYNERDSDSIDVKGVRLPWHKDVTINGLGKVASVFAINGPDDVGTVSCRITSNGKVLVERSATGRYALVSCISPVGER